MKKYHVISLSLLALFLMITGAYQLYSVRPKQQVLAASNTANFTVSPSSGTFQNGSTVSLSVYVSLDNSYNAASADFYYNSSRFQYVNAIFSDSFPSGRNASRGTNAYGSYISLSGNTTTGSLSGKKLLATLQFQMRSTGSAYGNFGATSAVLYPTKNYATSATNGSYTVANPAPVAPPPAPTPAPPTQTPTASPPAATTPTTTPKSTATPSASTKKTVKKSRATSVVPTASQPSASGLAISDFTITEKGYRSALLSWNTNVASTTKVNYGTDKEDLYLEQKDDKKVTEHRLQLDKENLRAGSRYYVRITSDDGKGPVTIDGDFYTKFISVVIKTTDENQKPLVDVSVNSGDAGGYTNEDGEVLLELPEGDVILYAEKGDLRRELAATIDLPSGDDLQRITLSMSPDSAPVASSGQDDKGGVNIGLIIGLVLLFLLGGFGLFVLIMRRRNARLMANDDPLEADNFTQHTIPSTPQPTTLKRAAPLPIATTDPVYTPVQNQQLEHHASLPELVGRYGAHGAADQPNSNESPSVPEVQHSPAGQPYNVPQQPVQATPQPLPQTNPATATPQQQPAPLLQQPPRHTSLKDLVHNEAPQSPAEDLEPINDLPVAPTPTSKSPQTEPPAFPSEDLLTIDHKE